MRSEFQAAIAQLIAEKGLPRDVVMETIANALLAAYRKSFGGGENVRIEVDKNGDVHVWASKRVVAQVKDPNEEISLAEAQRLIPKAALGQFLDVDSSFIFARIPAQTAKQVILQRIREAEHEHLYDQIKNWVGEFRLGLDLREARTWDDIVAQVARAAKQAKPGEWIVGRGWHQSKWDHAPDPNVEGFPLHASLDQVSPNNPVLLTHASGHAAFVNGKAMEAAGITRETKDPQGGEILKDKSGNPTGLLRE
jgi:hypothetical protein